MNSHTYFLIGVYYAETQSVLECALGLKNDQVPEGVIMYPESHKEWLHSMLPLYCRSCGPVVSARFLFSISLP